jgi:hypothetical protein
MERRGTTFDDLVREVEDDQVVEACRRLRLDDAETAAVLARHRTNPSLLRLVNVHGGTARDFVRSRVEIRRLLRAVDADQGRREIDWANGASG